MSVEMEKLSRRYHSEKDPVERRKIKADMDRVPMTTGELDQVQQREADRHAADVKVYREKRKQ